MSILKKLAFTVFILFITLFENLSLVWWFLKCCCKVWQFSDTKSWTQRLSQRAVGLPSVWCVLHRTYYHCCSIWSYSGDPVQCLTLLCMVPQKAFPLFSPHLQSECRALVLISCVWQWGSDGSDWRPVLSSQWNTCLWIPLLSLSFTAMQFMGNSSGLCENLVISFICVILFLMCYGSQP